MGEHTTAAEELTLTLDTLQRAIEELGLDRRGKWMRMVREARVVEIRASTYVPTDEIYALAVEPCTMFPFPEDRGKVLVVCEPRHEEEVRNVVARLRTPTTEDRGDER